MRKIRLTYDNSNTYLEFEKTENLNSFKISVFGDYDSYIEPTVIIQTLDNDECIVK